MTRHIHIHVSDRRRVKDVKEPHEPKAGGTILHKSMNMPEHGLKPKKRGDGSSLTETAQVLWSHAAATKQHQTAAITNLGWKVLGKGTSVAYGQPHVTVTPEGHAHVFHNELAKK